MWFIPSRKRCASKAHPFALTQLVAVFDEYSQQQLAACKYLHPPEPKYTFKRWYLPMHMARSSWVGCPATFAYWIIARVANVEDFKWFQKQLFFHLPWRLPIKSNEANKLCMLGEIWACNHLDATITFQHRHPYDGHYFCCIFAYRSEGLTSATLLCSQIPTFSRFDNHKYVRMAFSLIEASLCNFFSSQKHDSSWAFWPAAWKMFFRKISLFLSIIICFTAAPTKPTFNGYLSDSRALFLTVGNNGWDAESRFDPTAARTRCNGKTLPFDSIWCL